MNATRRMKLPSRAMSTLIARSVEHDDAGRNSAADVLADVVLDTWGDAPVADLHASATIEGAVLRVDASTHDVSMAKRIFFHRDNEEFAPALRARAGPLQLVMHNALRFGSVRISDREGTQVPRLGFASSDWAVLPSNVPSLWCSRIHGLRPKPDVAAIAWPNIVVADFTGISDLYLPTPACFGPS